MRWLLQKDLLILGRSRLLLALLVVYPVAVALLIGLAISRSPSRPRVAIVDETAPGETIHNAPFEVTPDMVADAILAAVETANLLAKLGG